MGQSKTSIEINGKVYDLQTGQLMHDTPVSAPRHIDDMVSRPAHSTPKPVVHHAPAATHEASVHRAVPTHPHASRQQKTTTLMRHAVKKPHITPKQALGAPTANVVTSSSPLLSNSAEKHSKRVAHTRRNHMISRYGAPLPNVVEVRTEPLAVKPAPPIAEPPVKHNTDIYKHPATRTHHTAAHETIHRALATADSHTQKHVDPSHRRHKVSRKLGVHHRLVTIGAGAAAVLIITGFIAYMNVPNLSMRVAARRSGIAASLPGNTPSGFGVKGAIQYQPGKVVVQFASKSDDRNFKLTQQSSKWNSETLKDNYVATLNQPYQTYQEKGKTIYLYDNSSATWVDGGIWYQVEGKSALNNEQLLQIANSL